MIFAQKFKNLQYCLKMPEFYTIIARKIFSHFFGRGARAIQPHWPPFPMPMGCDRAAR